MSMVILCLTFEEIVSWPSKSAASFFTFPPATYKAYNLSTSSTLPSLMSCHFYYSHTSECEVVFHCSFYLHSPDNSCVDEDLSFAQFLIGYPFVTEL